METGPRDCPQPLLAAGHLAGGATGSVRCALGESSTRSTRRLCARPSSVSLVSAGAFSPYPATAIRDCGNAELVAQDLKHRDAARGRELPVTAKARIVDGLRIGVAFQADRVRQFAHHGGDSRQNLHAARRHRLIPRAEKRGFPHADDQAARSELDLQFAILNSAARSFFRVSR